jgi:hypothetical protein
MTLNTTQKPILTMCLNCVRFAVVQHIVQEGETVESIARMLATTPEAIVNLNRNRITHFARPSAVGMYRSRERI